MADTRPGLVTKKLPGGVATLTAPARQVAYQVIGNNLTVTPEGGLPSHLQRPQVAYQVIGNDLTVTLAAEAGQLQLNAFEPIIAFNVFQSVTSAFLSLYPVPRYWGIWGDMRDVAGYSG